MYINIDTVFLQLGNSMIPRKLLINPHLSNTYVTFRRNKVKAARIELVISICNDFWWEESVQNATECAAIPVIGDSAAVVTFPSHVAQSIVRYLLEEKEKKTKHIQPQTIT